MKEETRLAGSLKRAGHAVEEAAELRSQIAEMMLDREMPRIQVLLDKYGAKAKNIEDILAENGVIPELIRELKNRGAIAF